MPPMAVRSELDAGTLYGRPIYAPVLTRRVALCRVKGIPETPAARAVSLLTTNLVYQLSLDKDWIETTLPTKR